MSKSASFAKSAAFTATASGKVNVLSCPVGVSAALGDPNSRQWHQFNAIWDTGATGSVVTESVVAQCGLKPTGVVDVDTGAGKVLKNTYLVGIRLPNGVQIAAIAATEMPDISGDFDVLIGMDIIGFGDFAVTNFQGKTTYTYRCPSVEEIDFVRDASEASMSASPVLPAVSSKGIVGRNDKCPCGSGKKYKKCHMTQ